MDGKHLMHFQSEIPVFNFPWHCVNIRNVLTFKTVDLFVPERLLDIPNLNFKSSKSIFHHYSTSSTSGTFDLSVGPFSLSKGQVTWWVALK